MNKKELLTAGDQKQATIRLNAGVIRTLESEMAALNETIKNASHQLSDKAHQHESLSTSQRALKNDLYNIEARLMQMEQDAKAKAEAELAASKPPLDIKPGTRVVYQNDCAAPTMQVGYFALWNLDAGIWIPYITKEPGIGPMYRATGVMPLA